MAKILSQSELQKFRHGISILKKQGLVPASVDARKAQPYWIRGGKRLGTQVKKFDDVISGKVEAVSLPQKKLREYKKAGYETAQKHVLVPKLKTDVVTVTKDNEIKIKEKSGIQRIKKAVPYYNLEQWLRDMQKDHLRIDAMKRRNEYFGYKIFGHHSYALYRTLDLMLQEMIDGTTSGLNLSEKIRHTSHKQQNEFFEHFEIVRVPRAEAWPSPPERKRGKQLTAKQRRLWYQRIKNTPKGAEMRRKAAERQKKFRETQKRGKSKRKK